jgi:hypothetical protein
MGCNGVANGNWKKWALTTALYHYMGRKPKEPRTRFWENYQRNTNPNAPRRSKLKM